MERKRFSPAMPVHRNIDLFNRHGARCVRMRKHRVRSISPACLALALLLVACGGSSNSPPSHIFLIAMGNQEFSDIIGSKDAPYTNELAQQYALADRYYAIQHPGLPNYLAMFSGHTFGIEESCLNCVVNEMNLVDALEAKGKTWKSYQEDLPRPCFLNATNGKYVRQHNPFVYFQDIRDNPQRCNQIVPLSQLDGDFTNNSVPDFSWITPNLTHDMHEGSVAEGDRWLTSFVPRFLASDAWKQNGALVIVWTEGKSIAGCCNVEGGQVPVLVITPKSQHGGQSTILTTHYGLLRTIEDAWGLPRLGNSASSDVTPLRDIFPGVP